MKRKEALNKRRERIIQLSMPKVSKAVWATLGPPIVWGNQELMRPISKAALKARTSSHLLNLAAPKKDFQLDHPEKCSREHFVYSCGRPSVIWEVQSKAMKTVASKRVEELSKPKSTVSGYEEDRLSYVLGCGRSSPIWRVSKSAGNVCIPERVNELARPRSLHRLYQPSKEVEWLVSDAAKNAKSTSSIESLARPKERTDLPFRDPEWVIQKSTLSAHTSVRVEELSKPKKLTDGYLPNRDVEWKVSGAAMSAKPTERLHALAVPVVRDAMDYVQFDPLAFQVKKSALKGKVPSRINDLAKPIIRGAK